jgi:hypothetical protein
MAAGLVQAILYVEHPAVPENDVKPLRALADEPDRAERAAAAAIC